MSVHHIVTRNLESSLCDKRDKFRCQWKLFLPGCFFLWKKFFSVIRQNR